MIEKSIHPNMIGLMKDPANIITMVGLFCSTFGIYFAIKGILPAAIIMILWAVLFDWFDGPVSRWKPGKRKQLRLFGASFDSLVDIVSFGIFPAVILLSYGNFNLLFLPGAILLIFAGVIRLAYFNTFGLYRGKMFVGLTIDTNGLVVAFVFLLDGFVSKGTFSIILYMTIVALALMNVSSIKIPKPSRVWYYIVTIYVVGLTIVFLGRL